MLCWITWLAKFLAAIGAMNWGLAKFFDFNLVEYLGNMIKLDKIKEVIYGLVALSGLFSLVRLFM